MLLFDHETFANRNFRTKNNDFGIFTETLFAFTYISEKYIFSIYFENSMTKI